MDRADNVFRFAACLDRQCRLRDHSPACTAAPIKRFVSESNNSFVIPSTRTVPAGCPRENTTFIRDALSLGLAFGQTHPGNFRIGIGHRRNHSRLVFRDQRSYRSTPDQQIACNPQYGIKLPWPFSEISQNDHAIDRDGIKGANRPASRQGRCPRNSTYQGNCARMRCVDNQGYCQHPSDGRQERPESTQNHNIYDFHEASKNWRRTSGFSSFVSSSWRRSNN